MLKDGFLLCLAILAASGIRTAISFPFDSTQTPFAPPPQTNNASAYPIISESTTRYFEHLRRRYGLKGLTIAVVASPEYARGDDWLNQTISLGEADVLSSAVTDEVCLCISLQASAGFCTAR